MCFFSFFFLSFFFLWGEDAGEEPEDMELAISFFYEQNSLFSTLLIVIVNSCTPACHLKIRMIIINKIANDKSFELETI